MNVAGIWQHVPAPGRSALLGVPAAGLNGAAGVEHIWCAGSCSKERDSDCFGDSALLRGAQGVVIVQVAYLQSVTVQKPVLLCHQPAGLMVLGDTIPATCLVHSPGGSVVLSFTPLTFIWSEVP